ncbi:hypothetical protein TNCV_4042741 [Trichonephila clavipes]|nr:hypothetical protein TNCV_4042741 [Trichonephila clavipes]
MEISSNQDLSNNLKYNTPQNKSLFESASTVKASFFEGMKTFYKGLIYNIKTDITSEKRGEENKKRRNHSSYLSAKRMKNDSKSSESCSDGAELSINNNPSILEIEKEDFGSFKQDSDWKQEDESESTANNSMNNSKFSSGYINSNQISSFKFESSFVKQILDLSNKSPNGLPQLSVDKSSDLKTVPLIQTNNLKIDLKKDDSFEKTSPEYKNSFDNDSQKDCSSFDSYHLFDKASSPKEPIELHTLFNSNIINSESINDIQTSSLTSEHRNDQSFLRASPSCVYVENDTQSYPDSAIGIISLEQDSDNSNCSFHTAVSDPDTLEPSSLDEIGNTSFESLQMQRESNIQKNNFELMEKYCNTLNNSSIDDKNSSPVPITVSSEIVTSEKKGESSTDVRENESVNCDYNSSWPFNSSEELKSQTEPLHQKFMEKAEKRNNTFRDKFILKSKQQALNIDDSSKGQKETLINNNTLDNSTFQFGPKKFMTNGGRITLHSNNKNNGYLKNRFSDSKIIRKPLTPDTLLSVCTSSPPFQKRRRLLSDKRKRNRKVKNELKEYNLITHYKKDNEIANKCHRMQNVASEVQKAEETSLPDSEELQIKVNSSEQFPIEYLLPINLQKDEPSSAFVPLQKYDDVGRKCTTKKEKCLTIPFSERQERDCIGLQDKTTNSSFIKASTSVSEAQETHGLKAANSFQRVTKSFESCKKNLPLLFSIDDKAEKSSNFAMYKRLLNPIPETIIKEQDLRNPTFQKHVQENLSLPCRREEESNIKKTNTELIERHNIINCVQHVMNSKKRKLVLKKKYDPSLTASIDSKDKTSETWEVKTGKTTNKGIPPLILHRPPRIFNNLNKNPSDSSRIINFNDRERSYANQKSIEAKKTQNFQPIRYNELLKGTTNNKPIHFKSNRSLFTTPKRDNIERVFSVLSPRCQSAPPFPIKDPIEFSDKIEELNMEVPSKSLVPQNNTLEAEMSNVIPSKNKDLECSKSCVNNYDSERWSPTKFLIKCVKQSTNETEKKSINKQESHLAKPKSSPNLRKSSDRKAKTKALILLKQTTSKRSVRSNRRATVKNGLYEVRV